MISILNTQSSNCAIVHNSDRSVVKPATTALFRRLLGAVDVVVLQFQCRGGFRVAGAVVENRPAVQIVIVREPVVVVATRHVHAHSFHVVLQSVRLHVGRQADHSSTMAAKPRQNVALFQCKSVRHHASHRKASGIDSFRIDVGTISFDSVCDEIGEKRHVVSGVNLFFPLLCFRHRLTVAAARSPRVLIALWPHDDEGLHIRQFLPPGRHRLVRRTATASVHVDDQRHLAAAGNCTRRVRPPASFAAVGWCSDARLRVLLGHRGVFTICAGLGMLFLC